MAQLQFLCPEHFAIQDMLQAVYAIAIDGSAQPTRAVLDGGVLTVIVPNLDTFRFCVPWEIPGVGHQLVTTGTLLVREAPYRLSVELARGLCTCVRNQAAEWDAMGLQLPDKYIESIRQAGRTLIQAILMSADSQTPNAEVEEWANRSLFLTTVASQALLQCYVERILLLRNAARDSQNAAAKLQKIQTPEDDIVLSDEEVSEILSRMNDEHVVNLEEENTPTSSDTAVHIFTKVQSKQVGVAVDFRPLETELKDTFLDAFSSVTLRTSWRTMEANPEVLDEYLKQLRWYYSNGFSITMGPLVDFSAEYLPPSLAERKGNFAAICQRVRPYVENIVKKCRAQVHTWIASARVNSHFALGLTTLEQLELTAQIIQWIHEAHPTAKVITSLDQPWGDNERAMPLGVAGHPAGVLPPTVCAEVLIRSRLKFDGFQLEFNVGYPQHATCDRPAILWASLMDQWSSLGRPLYLSFQVPSSIESDPKAFFPALPLWQGWTPRQQTLWGSMVLPMLLAKPYVYGIEWGTFRDFRPHDFPHGGLVSSTGRVKRMFGVLSDLQARFSCDE